MSFSRIIIAIISFAILSTLGENVDKPLQFNLVVTYFDNYDKDHDRTDEFARCFRINVDNKYIKKIYVLYENFKNNIPSFLVHKKIEIIPLDHYPIHKDFYDFINAHLAGELVIFANTDIFFDDTLKSLRHVNFDNHIVILTRWNLPEYNGHFERHVYTHDSWIFRAPIRYLDGNFKINRFSNELIMLDEWMKCGYTASNPSLTVKSWHVHQSDYRTQEVVDGYDIKKLGVKLYPIPFTSLPE